MRAEPLSADGTAAVGSVEGAGPGAPPDQGSWAARHDVPLTVACALLPAVLYVGFVSHYAVNSLIGDDWNTLPAVHDALHGHLGASDLWGQYQETRIVVVRLTFILFARLDHLDVRTIVIANALVFVASYGVVLALFRRYTGRALTPVPVLAIGVIWFSVADVQTSLWAFQVGWYLVVWSYLVAVYALLVPKNRRGQWLAIAVASGVLGSLAFVQGFMIWPVGAACILWTWRAAPRPAVRLGIRLGAAVATTGVYLIGFDTSQTGCLRFLGCVPGAATAHPLQALRFLVLAIGNVVPGGFVHPVGSFVRFEVLGAILLTAALAILVLTWRWRRTSEQIPVPAVLILFGLGFDVFIVVGRTGTGPAGAIDSNRYLLANLVLLTGILCWVLARLPRATDRRAGRVRTSVFVASWTALVVLVATQAATATDFGIRVARFDAALAHERSQAAVNLDRVPAAVQQCEGRDFYLLPGPIDLAREDGLAEFSPNSYAYFRRLAPVPRGLHCGTPVSAG